MNVNRKLLLVPTVLTAVSLSLTGCSNSEKNTDERVDTATTGATTIAPVESGESTSTQEDSQESAVTFEGYASATTEDNKDLSSVFGTFTNNSDEPIVVSSITGSADATYEIHEVVDGSMKVKDGGITIPAQGDYVLQPGGDHLMIMNLKDPLNAGDQITLTLTTNDGQTISLRNIPVRAQASGQEDYSDINR